MRPGPPRPLLLPLVVAAVLACSSAQQPPSGAVDVLASTTTLFPATPRPAAVTPGLPLKKNLTVGYLAAAKGNLKNRQGLAISGALTIALEEVNNDPSILPHVNLVVKYNDTKGESVRATRAMTDMICEGVAVFFGPEGYCQTEAIVAQSRDIPMISYKCSDYFPTKIPTFARTEPPDTQVTKSVISLLQYYKWEKFSILYEDPWSRVASELQRQAKDFNLTINHNKLVADNFQCCSQQLDCCLHSYWYNIIKETKNQTRIYVFLGFPPVLIEIMDQMQSQQLFDNGEYIVIFVDMMTYSKKEALNYIWKLEVQNSNLCIDSPAMFKRARSLLVVVASPPDHEYSAFVDKVKEYNKKAPFHFTVPPLFMNSSFSKYVSNYAAYLYDSVKLYANALDYLLKQKGNLTSEIIDEVASNGTKIIETIMKNQTYRSVTGAAIKLDEKGDSEGNFSVLAWKPVADQFVVGQFRCSHQLIPVATFLLKGVLPEYKLSSSNIQIDWPGGHKPVAEPSCGFNHEYCKEDGEASKVAAGTLAVILFCASVITLSIYRKWKIEQEIEGLLWKINREDLHGYYGNDIVSSPSKLSLMSGTSYESRCGPQVFAITSQYKGVRVRIKELKFSKKKDISREVMKEMRLLRDIRHDNINSFIGACLEPMRVLIITDYCAKGSLYDIVENEDIKLDRMFIASLVHDLIKGMLYVHGSVLNFHGNLKSSNCVVTSRWVLQITDFGLHELRQCAENDSIGEHQYYRNMLWKAPELLRNPHLRGTQKGDVYAFGIILYEIISRKDPFGSSSYEPKDIITLVRDHIPGEVPFRPKLDKLNESETGCAEFIQTCIQDCMAENPESRPDFQVIRNRLKKMKDGMQRNIMDQMMDMMEKYANDLEDLVSERTRLLCEEKLKTEALLHRMLPPPVAVQLTNGIGVEPESFDLVTIYFSDIVGFTAMSAESTPLQVVNFLNDLYTLFDRIIKGYGVYKVETIGDAYMVVSGLPIRNGDLHAGEIASMSLDLLEAVKSHRIVHRPAETLKLRIGIHTGPVVAGVVGLTMPRYCLFGDTVNTASRMESNGIPLRIHISPQCREALLKIGGYIMDERGLVEMKGKGAVKTYWLTGATDKAVQRKEVDLAALPPLFSWPRRSPRLLSDSRQASICGGFGAGSRRQSSVPRGTGADVDSTSTVGINSSPLTRIKRPLLCLTDSVVDPVASEATASTVPAETPPQTPTPSLAQPMREAHSLDPFPDIKNKPLEVPHLNSKRSYRSLENCTRESGAPIVTNHTSVFPNGDVAPALLDETCIDYSSEDVQVPLLGNEGNEARVVIGNCRQGRSNSETFPTKRWRSLEEIPGNTSPNIETPDKKPRGSIRSWIVGLFNGNGLRTSDASLRKGIHGGFGDIQLEKESIV